MTTVTAATSATTAANNTTGTAKSGLSSDFETFLRMLTVQMQNQDPLNPMESSDFAVQLATFSGVEQQVKTNDLLESLSAQMGLMGMSELAGWVGMEARVAAPVAFDGAPVTLAPNPVTGADGAVLVVRDDTGAEVARQATPVSAEPISWSGRDEDGAVLPAGLYSFELESYHGDALLGTNPVEAYCQIVEARGTGSGTMLVLAGGASVSAADITALRLPGQV